MPPIGKRGIILEVLGQAKNGALTHRGIYERSRVIRSGDELNTLLTVLLEDGLVRYDSPSGMYHLVAVEES